MIRSNVERTIVVRDSDDETSFTIHVRDVEDVAADHSDPGHERHVMMPELVWLTIDDTEQLGRELIALAQVLREERPVVDVEPDTKPAKKAVAKKAAAPRKRAAKKTTGAVE